MLRFPLILKRETENLTHIGITTVRQTQKIRSVGKNWRNENLRAEPLWKTVGWVFKKLNIKLPYYPAIPLLGIYIKGVKKET